MQITPSGLDPYVRSWSPEAITDDDVLSPGPVAALSAVLDLSGPVAGVGDPLPPLWHWLYFLRWPAQRDLGADGHPLNGQFLPPIPDRQRMFAGGRCLFTRPLVVGEPVRRLTALDSVTTKHGSTGELLFVSVRSEFRQRGATCVVEEQDIVYRSGRGAARHPAELDTAAAPRSEQEWRFPLDVDPTMLFRFSALTANAHRIHYDMPYVTDREGYPGLVVHGPLLVLAMLELVRRNSPTRAVRSLSYRLRRPVFAGERLLASGAPAEYGAALRIATHREERHATAEVTFG
ncbi:FAS1-like dehydratase domain-containing protein [Embleya sp. MST-111070]|uniref:FAS1-like dehydratase domain-containing protein n=1 Tax=Embleya sp. MST-111070 TaxID=3398231 RepID=UPI003F73EE8A